MVRIFVIILLTLNQASFAATEADVKSYTNQIDLLKTGPTIVTNPCHSQSEIQSSLQVCYQGLIKIPPNILKKLEENLACFDKKEKKLKVFLHSNIHTNKQDNQLAGLVFKFAQNEQVYLYLEENDHAQSSSSIFFNGLQSTNGQLNYLNFQSMIHKGEMLAAGYKVAPNPWKKSILTHVLTKVKDGLYFFKDEWIKLGRPFPESKSEQFAKGIDQLISQQVSTWNDDLIINDPSILIKILERFAPEVEKKLLSLDEYKGYDPAEFLNRSLGPIRELDWIRFLKQDACSINSEKPVWIEAGIGHKDTFLCALKSAFKDKIDIVDISSGPETKKLLDKQTSAFFSSDLPSNIKEKVKEVLEKHSIDPEDCTISITADQDTWPGFIEVKFRPKIANEKFMNAQEALYSGIKKSVSTLLGQEGKYEIDNNKADFDALYINPVQFSFSK